MCGCESIAVVPGYERFLRVTSDCRPWLANGHLFVCDQCGIVQKKIDTAWQAEIEILYKGYDIYHQSGGEEQAVFEKGTGIAFSRSSELIRKIIQQFNLPQKGRLLDIGCGNGSFLRSFARVNPEWSLVGTELDSKYSECVDSIEQVEKLYCCSPENIPGDFDLITMIHLLEHIPNPGVFLQNVKSKLKQGGMLVIEIPDYQMNPFDLLIADHCTHFTSCSLGQYVKACGFRIIMIENSWIQKETTAILGIDDYGATENFSKCFDDPCPISCATDYICWLDKMIAQAKKIAAGGSSFGIFGTSIAATWLASEMKTGIDFFVDEDRNRTGKIFMGRPIVCTEEVPVDSNVFIALPDIVAADVYRRLKRRNLKINLYRPDFRIMNRA